MALYDLVAVSTATMGTGSVTLGAALPGFRNFTQAAVPNGATVSYAIENGVNRETGRGVYNSSTGVLTRVLEASSTGALLNLTGTSIVFITAIAKDFAAPATVAEFRAGSGSGYISPSVGASAVNYVVVTRSNASAGLDFGTFVNVSILLDANLTIGGWIPGYPGQTGRIRFIQDATGSRTVAWASGYIIPAGFSIQSTVNGVTDAPYVCEADGKIRLYSPSKWTA